eukprot:5816711-Prymnesium_polylepis.2
MGSRALVLQPMKSAGRMNMRDVNVSHALSTVSARAEKRRGGARTRERERREERERERERERRRRPAARTVEKAHASHDASRGRSSRA